jgi:hypothetical protein
VLAFCENFLNARTSPSTQESALFCSTLSIPNTNRLSFVQWGPSTHSQNQVLHSADACRALADGRCGCHDLDDLQRGQKRFNVGLSSMSFLANSPRMLSFHAFLSSTLVLIRPIRAYPASFGVSRTEHGCTPFFSFLTSTGAQIFTIDLPFPLAKADGECLSSCDVIVAAFEAGKPVTFVLPFKSHSILCRYQGHFIAVGGKKHRSGCHRPHCLHYGYCCSCEARN